MESYNGNRSPERGHYSYNNSRNQNRSNYRRMNSQGMGMSYPSSRQSNTRRNDDCPCQEEAARRETMRREEAAAERSSDCGCQAAETKCDNGASASDRTCDISYINDPLYGMTPAMAYVPWQRFHDTYEICRALQVGTIFPELDYPFLIGRCAQCR